MEILSGNATRLGAHYDGEGTNFALFSAHAEAVELCLYDSSGQTEIARLSLPEKSHDVWHGYVPGLHAGAVYGYRVHGRYDPHAGHRFNPSKLLIDPYARKLTGSYQWNDANFGYQRNVSGTRSRGGKKDQDLEIDTRDNAAYVSKAVVCDRCTERSAARPDRAQHRCGHRVPWHQTAIYETHVRGFTMLHPEVPPELRGTFAGLASPAVVDYIRSLGITTIELMPVHAFVDEYHLHQKGLSNYWGYNSLGFFAPHQGYLAGGEQAEFRRMVNTFHDAGMEVILDVVYNHTCEGDHLGPTLGFRGIDNLSYYQTLPGDRRFYINDTGCGNTINIHHPRVLQMILDSLRYWAGEMEVDGFRFDLASVLGRTDRGFSAVATFFQAVAQDPILSACKMIAEPWDLGPGGYQLGRFPAGWSEWNDRYRDSIRRFWRGDSGELPELARRLHGSGDIFEHEGRTPRATINFVASHDGFSLRDLVSYSRRHNQANGENNNDGHRGDYSYNHGHEGETDDEEINRLRWQQQKNFLATLVVSQGIPMLLAGDEFGRTQQGNNNAYCQDNEVSWLDWQAAEEGRELTRFTRQLLNLRKHFGLLQASQYRHQPDDGTDDSIHWLNSDGQPMNEQHWHERNNHLLGYLLVEGDENDRQDGKCLLVIFNAERAVQQFRLPADYGDWHLFLDSASSQPDASVYSPSSLLELAACSTKILTTESIVH